MTPKSPPKKVMPLALAPVLITESCEDYDIMRSELFDYFCPRDSLEAMLVGDLVDIRWEANRLRDQTDILNQRDRDYCTIAR